MRQTRHPLKVHCYPVIDKLEADQTPPDRSFGQIAKDASERLCKNYKKQEALEELHPIYDEESDAQFVKEMYRLKGFAYLRN